MTDPLAQAQALFAGEICSAAVERFAAAIGSRPLEPEMMLLAANVLHLLGVKGPVAAAAPLHRLYGRPEPGAKDDRDLWMELALGLYLTGALTAAARITDRVYATAPPDTPARAAAGLVRGFLHLSYGRPDDARDALAEALAVCAGRGWPVHESTIRANLITVCVHRPGGATEIGQILRNWLDAGRPEVAETLQVTPILRTAGLDLYALDLLAEHADRDWTAEPGPAQLAWLEEFVTVVRELADDAAAAELCVRMVGLDDRIARSTITRLGLEDYDRIARAYDLLVAFYAELARFDDAMRDTVLAYLEAAKEAAFSRASPTLQLDALPAPVAAEVRDLTRELANLEAAAESRVRTGLTRSVLGGDARGLVIHQAHELERQSETRIAEVKARLDRLRATEGDVPAGFRSFLDVRPDRLGALFASARWPARTAALSYRLARDDNELTVFLVRPDGSTAAWTTEVNPAALDALLVVLGHHPEEELDYIVERLTGLLLPAETRTALAACAAETLLVSPDPSLLTVPWEALGAGDDRLGLRYQLCRSPSLLRSAAQIEAAPTASVPIGRALLVINPTGDLAAAGHEGGLVDQMLTEHGIETTVLRDCRRADLLRELPGAALVHYAGHTNFLRTDPASSHFLLADGPLTIGELAGVPLHPDALFYLSSCESAQAGGDARLSTSWGLGSILSVKGAAAVIGSNWPADDVASAAMVQPFYSRLLAGEPIGQALRAARAEVAGRDAPVTAWALPALTGHPFIRVANGSPPAK